MDWFERLSYGPQVVKFVSGHYALIQERCNEQRFFLYYSRIVS